MDGYNNYYSPAPAGFTSFVTVRNILKILAGISILFFFIPVFFASCGGERLYISGVKATFGLGDLDAYPLVVLLLLLGIAVMVILFIKAIPDLAARITNLSLVGCEFIGWIIFFFYAKGKAGKSGAGFGMTAAFPIMMIFRVIELIVAILVMINLIKLDTNLVDLFKSDKMKQMVNNSLDKVSNVVSNASDGVASVFTTKPNAVVLGYCQTCGKPITLGNKFCVSCGTPTPAELIAKGEQIEAQMAEQARLAEEARLAEQARIAAEQARLAEERARMAAQNNMNMGYAPQQQMGMPAPQVSEPVAMPAPQMGMPIAPAPQMDMPVAPAPQPISVEEAGLKTGLPIPPQPEMDPNEPTVICKSCGATLRASMKFCNMCGAKQD